MVHTTLSGVAEIEINYKPKCKAADRPQIKTSQEAYDIFIAHWSMGRIEFLEELKMLLLNRRNRVLGIVDISMGGVSGTLADPKVIFAIALKSGASEFWLPIITPVRNWNRARQMSTLHGDYSKVENYWTLKYWIT